MVAMDQRRDPGAVFVRLLGRPEVRWARGSDDLLSGMPKRLLAYLAVRGGEVGRDEVAALLWPEHDLERRRGNLRRTLGRAKELPYAAALDADRERLRWPVATDLALVAAGDGSAAERASLVAHTLLEGLELDEDDAFAAWLSEERERLQRLRRRLLSEHARERLELGDVAAASTTLERLVDEDPLDEEALQRYLEVAVAAGAAARGRAAYRRFVDQLDRELGLAPLEATRALAAGVDGSLTGVAGDAIAAPLRGNGTDAPSRAASSPEAAIAAVPPTLEGGLVGRSRTLDRLRSAGSRLLVVTGEPGVGKTAAVRAAFPGAATLWLRAESAGIGRPFAAVASALRDVPGNKVGALEVLHQRERAVLAWLDPRVAGRSHVTGRIVDPAEGRGRLVMAAAAALRSLLGADGVLIVDDVHELDGASVDVVVALVRDRARAPSGPRILATARPAELADAEGRGALERLEADGLLERLALEPWTEDELHALVAQLSGSPGGRLFARRLHAATGGNALFVLETLRHLFTVGLLSVDPQGGWSTPFDDATEDYAELPLPPTVRDAVRERITRLDAGTRRLLEAASLAVPPFTLERVAPATALSEWLAVEALEGARRSGLLVVSGDGYRFGHELLRRAVADALAPERRALVERRLAWALERERGSPGLIAAHFERAGRRGDAYRWHRRAAEEATALYVPSVAIEHLERAAALAEHDRERVEVFLEWAALLDRTVDPRTREDVLERAKDVAERVGDARITARVAIARVGLALDAGDVAAALEIGERARPLAHAAALGAELQLALARAHLKAGDASAAAHALDVGAADLEPGPNELRGRYHLEGYVNCAHLRGDLAGAFEHTEAALAVFEAIGHRELMAEALNYHGIFLAFDGRHDDGISRLEEGLAIAREVGHVAVQRRALLNLVKLHTDRADADAAAPLVAEGLALAHDFEQRTTEVAFLLADGYVRYLRADLGGANRAFARAAEVVDGDSNPMWRAIARFVAVPPLIHAGEVAGAAALLREAESVLAEHDLMHLRPRLDARRASLALAEGDAHAALAIVQPWRERAEVPAEERGEHALVRATAYARLGDHERALEAAAECVGAPTLEVVLAGEALTLESTLASGRDPSEALAIVQRRVDSGRAPPFEGLALMRALAAAHEHGGDGASAAVLRREAEEREARLKASAATIGATRPV